MGCTGSKPHLLLTSGGGSNGGGGLGSNGNGLAPSPSHKGLILFNSRTLAYLRAHQVEIGPALTKRCSQKLETAAIPVSKSSILKPKKTSAAAAISTSASAPAPLADQQPLIGQAVDYVMHYALNEFDLSSFSRSNHLSMKQIRKDILKKASSDLNDPVNSTPFYKVFFNISSRFYSMSSRKFIFFFN